MSAPNLLELKQLLSLNRPRNRRCHLSVEAAAFRLTFG